MGVETMAAVAIGSAIYGGITAKGEADKQAGILKREGENAAEQEMLNAEAFADQQALDFSKSGITLEGSPLLFIEETRRRGLAGAENMRQSSRARASALQTAGRNRLFGGILAGVAEGASLNKRPRIPKTQTTVYGSAGQSFTDTGSIA